MSKYNPFSILGVPNTADFDQLFEGYKKARAKYENMRFEPGEKGAEACLRLDEIEQAYRDARDLIQTKDSTVTGVVGDELERADSLIKNKRYSEAQSVLSTISNRDARWHYLQSIVFYAQDQNQEALVNLKKAVELEPNNNLYTTALSRLEAKVSGRPGFQRTEYYARETGDNTTRSYRQSPYGRGETRGCSIFDICGGLCLADCCCECMGGDLIACC